MIIIIAQENIENHPAIFPDIESIQPLRRQLEGFIEVAIKNKKDKVPVSIFI